MISKNGLKSFFNDFLFGQFFSFLTFCISLISLKVKID